MKRSGIVVVAIAAMGAANAEAAPMGFATNTANELHLVDFGTGATTFIGATGGVVLQSLAFGPDGGLYGTDIAGRFYSVDTATGAATEIAPHGTSDIEAMDSYGGVLYAADLRFDVTTFYTIDPATAAATELASTDEIRFVRAGAMYDATTMYLAVDLDGLPWTDNNLYSIDLVTGVLTYLGGELDDRRFAGMDFSADKDLYALTSDGEGLVFDEATRSWDVIFDTGDDYWLGLAMFDSAEIAEPASLAVMAFGLFGIGAATRRRRSA